MDAVRESPACRFAPGFRFSIFDGVVILAGAVVAIWLAMVVWQWGFAIGFVLSHFFLFCNVIRMARSLELTWAAIFLALSTLTVLCDEPGLLAAVLLSLVATIVVVGAEMRKPSYHGAGWRKVNPSLPQWWESRQVELGKSAPSSGPNSNDD